MTGPQLALFHFGLERSYQRVALGIAHVIRMAEHVVERLDFLAHELLDPIQLLLEFRFGFKIPTHDNSPSSRSVLPVWVLSILSARTMATSPARFASEGPPPASPARSGPRSLALFALLILQDDTSRSY